jgi:enamine deaminase RidA (YjgF/YER057c/UK114 family)
MPAAARGSDVEGIHVAGFPPTVGPYSDVVAAGGLIWISGIVAMDESGHVVSPGDPGSQIRFVLERLRDALFAAGSDPSGLVQITNYVTDAGLRSLVHRERESILHDATPASTMVVVAGLIDEQLVYEVEAVALAAPSEP